MGAQRVSRGEVVAGAAGGLLFASSFVPAWAELEVTGFDAGVSFSLWGAYGFLPALGALIGLAVAAVVALRAAGTGVGLPPAGYAVAGVATTVCMVVALVSGPLASTGADLGIPVHSGPGPLPFAGLVLGAAMVAGGWLHLRASGEAFRS